MANVGTLSIIVGASVGPLKTGLSSAASTVKGFASSVGGMTKSIGSSVAGVGGMLMSGLGPVIAAVGAGGLAIGLTKAAQSIDQVAKSADTLGVGTEELIGLRHAADLSGVSAEQLDTGLGKMLRTIGQASMGSESAAKSLGTLGLSVGELQGMKADQQFGVIADKIAGITDPAERAAAAMQIFGRGGMAMIPMILEGSEGVKAATAETVKLGTSLSRLDAKKVEQMNDAFGKVKDAVGGVFQGLVVQLAPMLESTFTSAAFWIADAGKALKTFVGSGIREIKFFVQNFDLEMQLVGLQALHIFDSVAASIGASFDAGILAVTAFAGNFTNIMTSATHDIFPVIGQITDYIGSRFVTSFDDVATLYNYCRAFITGEASPLTLFKNQFDKTMTDIKGSLGDVNAQSSGAAAEFGSNVASAFKDSFNSRVDKDLSAQLKRVQDKLLDLHVAFNEKEMSVGIAKAATSVPKADVSEAAIAGASGISNKFAAATQVGSSEAATQILAGIAAKRGEGRAEEKETAKNTARTNDLLQKLIDRDPIEFDTVEAF